jgi:hypothetical protein
MKSARTLIRLAPVFGLVILCGCDRITPADRTDTNAGDLRRALNEFIAASNHPPSGLTELMAFDPRIKRSRVDGWGADFTLWFEGGDIGVISSPSKFIRSKEHPEHVDLIWRFALKNPSGQWIGTNFGCWGWLSNPFMPELANETRPREKP